MIEIGSCFVVEGCGFGEETVYYWCCEIGLSFVIEGWDIWRNLQDEKERKVLYQIF